MKKKVVALVLSLAMCTSVLVGCSTDSSTNASGSTAQNSNSSSAQGSGDSAGSTESKTPENVFTDENGFTWEQTWPDGQKIEIMIEEKKATDGISEMDEFFGIKMIEEKFKVDLVFTPFAGDSDTREAQYLTTVASEDLPDVIFGKNRDYYGYQRLYDDGISIELNELIETKMPNYKKFLEENPNIARDLRTQEGKYLFFARTNPFANAADVASNAGMGLIIRQDWLDAVGMDAPTTIDEWYNVLSAFKTMDPNGNGQQDEIPFDGSDWAICYLAVAYKTLAPSDSESGIEDAFMIIPGTKTVEYGPRTQEYKAFLEEMNKWYSEGLITNMFDDAGEPIDGSQAGGSSETIPADMAGVFKGNGDVGNESKEDSYISLLRAKKPEAAFTPLPNPTTDDGVVYCSRRLGRGTGQQYIITTDCECLDAVAVVFDYMLSEAGSTLLCWGEEGVTYEYDSNGNKKLTEKALEEYTKANGKTVRYFEMYGGKGQNLPTIGNFDIGLAQGTDYSRNASFLWGGADLSLTFPKDIILTAEQNEQVDSDNTELADYVIEMEWKFITGQEPLSNYDNYVSNLERMGISDIVAVYQSIYDAYAAE